MPFRCLFTAFPGPSTALSLPVLNLLPPFRCHPVAFRLPFHCLSLTFAAAGNKDLATSYQQIWWSLCEYERHNQGACVCVRPLGRICLENGRGL